MPKRLSSTATTLPFGSMSLHATFVHFRSLIFKAPALQLTAVVKSAARNITRGCDAIWTSRLLRLSLRDAQYSSTANIKRHTKARLLYVGQVWPGYVSGHQLRATGVPPPVPQKSTINLHTNTHA